MELHQLRYMVAVAEAGNFTRAAERHSIAQPSLSQQVGKLEKELGHKLFHRLGRRAVLTEAGHVFLERARRILADVENTVREIRDDPAIGNRIVVGAIPTVAPYLLPPLIERCRERHPHLQIDTTEDFRSQLVHAVVEGELDLALCSQPVRDRRLSVDPVFTEPLLLALGQHHPLLQKSAITIKDLETETFAMLGNSSTLTLQIQRFFGDHDFTPRIGYHCAQVATVKALVARGHCLSILPQVTRAPWDKGQLVYKKFGERSPMREIAVVRHLQRYQNRGTEQFIALLKEFVQRAEFADAG